MFQSESISWRFLLPFPPCCYLSSHEKVRALNSEPLAGCCLLRITAPPSSLAHSRNTICRSFYHLSCKGKVIGSTSQQCLNTQGAAHSRYCKHSRSSLCESNSLQNGPLSSSVQLDQFKSPFLSCKANWCFFPKRMSSLHPSYAFLHSKGFLIAFRFPQACALIRYFAVICSGLSFSRT